MYTLMSFLGFLILMVLGAPFYVSFLGCAVPFLFLVAQSNGAALAGMAMDSVNSFTLLAIPMFILLGTIMSRIGATEDLFNLAKTFVGHFRGGMGITAIFAAAGFGAMCGSGLATAMAISGIAVPELQKSGYSKAHIAAICASAGGVGMLIPPSLAFIMLGEVLQVSTGKLFLAGIIPGILITVLLSITCYLKSRNDKNIILSERYSWKTRIVTFVKTIPAFIVPASVLLTIYFGIATPTESAGVACFVSLLLGRFYYKNLDWSTVKAILEDTTRATTPIWFLMMGALIFGTSLSYERIPQMGSELITSMDLSYFGFIGAIFVLFILLGMLFDAFIMILTALPPLLIALSSYGVPGIWFSIIFTILVMIGSITPPVGVNLYASASGAGADVGDTIREIIPYIVAEAIGILLLVLIPQLVIY